MSEISCVRGHLDTWRKVSASMQIWWRRRTSLVLKSAIFWKILCELIQLWIFWVTRSFLWYSCEQGSARTVKTGGTLLLQFFSWDFSRWHGGFTVGSCWADIPLYAWFLFPSKEIWFIQDELLNFAIFNDNSTTWLVRRLYPLRGNGASARMGIPQIVPIKTVEMEPQIPWPKAEWVNCCCGSV